MTADARPELAMQDSSPTVSGAAPVANDIRLLDLLQVVLENFRLLVFVPLAVGVVAVGLSFLIRPTFTARTAFIPPLQQQPSLAAGMLAGLGNLGGLAGGAGAFRNPMDQYVSFARSRSIADALIDKYKLVERYESKLRADALTELQSNLRISGGRDGLIVVEVDDHDPKVAAAMANSVVEEFQRVLGRLAVTDAQQRRAFFEKQLQATKDALVRAESALRATGVSDATLKSNPAVALAGVATLKAQVTAQEVRIASLRSFMVEGAPELQRALSELAALRSQLSKQESTEPSASQESGKDYVSRYREFKYQETLFELYSRQFEVARADEAREGAVVQVLDVAQPPERKSKPRRSLVGLGTTLGTALVLLIFVLTRNAWRKGSSSEHGEAAASAVLRAAWRKGWGRA
jgi:uncharacterized protein involved in exopolysaccharide biosynthesis